jgi:hypothetical protein
MTTQLSIRSFICLYEDTVRVAQQTHDSLDDQRTHVYHPSPENGFALISRLDLVEHGSLSGPEARLQVPEWDAFV